MNLIPQKCPHCSAAVVVPASRPDLFLVPGVPCVVAQRDPYARQDLFEESDRALPIHRCAESAPAATATTTKKPRKKAAKKAAGKEAADDQQTRGAAE